MSTAIEWADVAHSVVRGCSPASAGCIHCYSARLDGTRLKRLETGYRYPHGDRETMADLVTLKKGKAGNNYVYNGTVRLDPAALQKAFNLPRVHKGKRGYSVFWNHRSDTFHERLTNEEIAAQFGVMAARPDLQFLVLTKRAKRMREWFEWADREVAAYHGLMHHADRCSDFVKAYGIKIPYGAIHGDVPWPLPNVRLGVSAENQETADERIPDLLATPAAIRFLSYEPALGSVDLRGWGGAKANPAPENMPTTWEDFTWPEWVSAEQRELIESFWSSSYGRGPRQWVQDNYQQSTPATGARVGVSGARPGWVCPAGDPGSAFRGRYVHRWNNMGAVVGDDGSVHTVASGMGPGWLSKWLQPDGKYRHRLHWIIVGAESGPNARPAELDWVRSVRDQVLAARDGRTVPLPGDPHLFVKQIDVCAGCHGLGGGVYEDSDGADKFDPCGTCGGSGLAGKVRKGNPAIDGRSWAEVPR